MTGFESKRDAAADKLQEPSITRPCRSCDGTGDRDTGIPESPIATCKPCNGTGQISLAQPAQEPVAWWGVDWGQDGNSVSIIKRLSDGNIEVLALEYAPHPPQRRELEAMPAHSEWNAALDEAASRIGEIKGFGQATQDSFATFIKGLKK